MEKQILLVVDQNGQHTGRYVEKDRAHTGRGKKHLAISVLLYNRKGKVLLQHRKHKIHNDIWDFTGSTHNMHKKDGTNETSEEATYRCLKREYGIDEKINLRVLGGVNYYAPYGEYCENEHDIILVGEYNGRIKPSKEVSYNYKWVDKGDFLKDIGKNPKKYAPWAVLGSELLKRRIESTFQHKLEEFLKIYIKYASKYFKELKSDKSYPELIGSYFNELEGFTAGGKKIRGFLVSLGYQIAGGQDVSKILPVALANEFLQSFFLIHDDIMDRSSTRRGKPSMHVRYSKEFGDFYGLSQAILVGDAANALGVELIAHSAIDNKKKLLVLENFNDITKTTIFGQGLDVEASYKKPTIDLIWKIIELKSARYSVTGPLTLGALCGEAKLELFKDIEKFGLLIGTVFQLHDDFLGVYGDEKDMGKPVLSDMQEGKNTLLFHKAMEFANGRDKKTLSMLWGKENATLFDLEKIKTIIEKSGALEWSTKEEERLVGDAKKYIPKLTKDKETQSILLGLCDFVISRIS